MWNTEDRDKVHLAGMNAEGERITDFAASTMRAGIFGGELYIEIIPKETTLKVEKPGFLTHIGLYDHCGYLCRTVTIDDPIEVGPKRFGYYVTLSDTKLTVT